MVQSRTERELNMSTLEDHPDSSLAEPLADSETASEIKLDVDELLLALRSKNRTIIRQQQRIEELESYLGCIVSLQSRVRELELDAS